MRALSLPLQPLPAIRIERVNGVQSRRERDGGADRRQDALVQQRGDLAARHVGDDLHLRAQRLHQRHAAVDGAR